MKKQKKTGIIFIAYLFFCCLFLSACGSKPEIEAETKDTGFTAAKTGVFDSADTAVIAKVNREEKTITLKNMEVKRQYTLHFDGTTYFYDKYGKVISVSQLEEGEIADVTFFKEKKRLNSLQLSDTAWSHKNISEYKMDEEKLQAEIGAAVYTYTDDIVVISEGEQKDIIEINPVDTLTFRGIGTELYSVVIEKGHGYVRLKNEEYFYGGWIEIGNKTIKRVAENMLLTVPEGSHQVIISNKGTSGIKNINVWKNMEIELDVGDLKGEEPRYGNVIFTISPKEALLYLDGENTDYSVPIRLEYGIHQMIVMAEGYETISQYLKVGQESAGIEVTMKVKESVSGNNVSGNNTSGNTAGVSNELLDEVNKILGEMGYDKITQSDLDKFGSGNTGTGTGGSSSNSGNTNDSSNNSSGTNIGTGSGSGGSSGNNSVTSTLSYYVTIDAPVGVEVYLDGNYVGIAPCSFKKEAGSHTVTLRKTGYTAKSYTLQIDSEEKNVSYSFLDLAAIE